MKTSTVTTEKINQEITIDATADKVWRTLTNETEINTWCKSLHPVSSIQSDWKVGSFVLYLDDFQSGVIGTITNRTADTIEVEYKGILNSGYEDFTSEAAQCLHGTGEKYTVITDNGQSKLIIEADVDPMHLEKMNTNWRNALEQIKHIAESLS